MHSYTHITDAMVDAALDAYNSADGTPLAPPDVCMRAALSAALAGHVVGWREIESAPKDGTRILVWFVHANAAYSKDPVAEGWEAAHEAYWIDHNGGGWTWYGLCGIAKYWQPLPAPPAQRGG